MSRGVPAPGSWCDVDKPISYGGGSDVVGTVGVQCGSEAFDESFGSGEHEGCNVAGVEISSFEVEDWVKVQQARFGLRKEGFRLLSDVTQYCVTSYTFELTWEAWYRFLCKIFSRLSNLH